MAAQSKRIPDAKRVRDLRIGDRFVLIHTGAQYELLAHDRRAPSGTKYVVRLSGFAAPTTLHHSCHVRLLEHATQGATHGKQTQRKES